MNILVADDDPISRHLLSALLTKDENNVVSCADGSQAINKLTTTSFDIAILDWMMPQISGVDVCRKLRHSGMNIYIILLTAKSSKTDLLEGLSAGADDYIVKPCDEQELRVRLSTGKRIIKLQRQVNGLSRTLNSLVTGLAQNSSNTLLSADVESRLKSLLLKVNHASHEVTGGFALKQARGDIDSKRQNWKYDAVQAITAIDAFQNNNRGFSSGVTDTL